MKTLRALFIACAILLISGCSQQSSKTDRAIGQMMMVGFSGTTINKHSPIVQAIKQYHIGGVLILDHDIINGKNVTRNISSPAQLKKLTAKLQAFAKQYGDPPLFIAANQEGGLINALKTKKGFALGENLSQAALGKQNNTNVTFKQAYRRGKLLKRYGINLDFSPVAALNINPNNPAIGKLQRSYSVNVNVVIQHLKAAIKGYKKANVFCTLKHFPGLGSADKNTDFAAADVTNTWQPKELTPYRQLINDKQACTFVMVTPLINRKLDPSGMQATLSKPIVTGLLRDKLHFKGLIITDDMDATAIRDHVPTTKAIRLAVLAGNNIILYGGTQGYNPEADTNMLFKTLHKLAEQDPEVRKQILQSNKRIMRVKETWKSRFNFQNNE